MRLNLLVLLGVGFLPFPTRLVAEAIHDVNGERVFVTMYGLTLLAIRIFGFALDEYAKTRTSLRLREDRRAEQSGRSNLAVLVVYVVAILIGLAVPPVAVAFYFGIAIYLVVPFREIRRLLFHRGRRLSNEPHVAGGIR